MNLARVGLLALAVFASRQAEAQKPPPPVRITPEQQTARYFESIRRQPLLLGAFLRQMPKGGDLHIHLSGAVYAESYVQFAANDGLCVDRGSLTLLQPPCDEPGGRPPAQLALRDPVLYRRMIDAFSMRNFQPTQQSGHDHFFDAFLKFYAASNAHAADTVAEVASRAAAEHVQYLELILNLDRGQSTELSSRVGWDEDLGRMRERLLGSGVAQLVAATRQFLDQVETRSREQMRCGTPEADPGCNVVARYIFEIYREFPQDRVFAQTLLGFELAQADARVAAINLVMPEDGYVAMRDYSRHMRMLDFLHKQYPRVHITLHAGELAPGLVPPEGLTFHVRDAVEVGHAERIGHGTDVMHEREPIALLRELAQRNVLVEICLTSNDMILGVRGPSHPFPIYLRYGVPVALATDDPGVARSDMTREYQRAVETYESLSYADLKRMARQSLTHSFLPGSSLWTAPGSRRQTVCDADDPVLPTVSPGCRRLLDSSERARLEWQLEADFARFERQIAAAAPR
jgi:hypothetical protein